PFVLVTLSTAVALALAVPLVFLLIEASGAGLSHVIDLIARPLTAELLWNTVRLTVAVTVLCAIIGTGAAWLGERTTRPADPSQEEVSRSLGVGRLRTFVRITLGQARGAILGGCLLVALVLLAEYGAFELLGFQTFTTEIFTEFNLSFSVPAACALSLVLVVLSLLVLAGEGMLRGKGRVSRSGPLAARQMPPHRLGRATLPTLAGFAVLTALALGVPVGSSIYWMAARGSHAILRVSLTSAALHTAV